jgi:hypothetical protein
MRALCAAVLMCAVVFGGCRTLHGDRISSARATISGSVRAPGHEKVTAHRDITIVDVESGRTFHAQTNDVGDYTALVPPGTYRVNVVLRPSEVLSAVAEPVQVEAGGIKSVDLIIAAAP